MSRVWEEFWYIKLGYDKITLGFLFFAYKIIEREIRCPKKRSTNTSSLVVLDVVV